MPAIGKSERTSFLFSLLLFSLRVTIEQHDCICKQSAAKLDELLHEMDLLQSKGIAVAINNEIISKTHWNQQAVKPKDRVTIIRATQGG